MKKQLKIHIFATFCIALITFLAPPAAHCQTAHSQETAAAAASVNPPAKVSPIILQAQDKKIQLELPPGWIEGGSDSEDAEFAAVLPKNSLYVLVISESKEDFKDLKSYGEIVKRQMSKRLEDTEISTPEERTVSSYPAIDYQIKATLKSGLRVGYLLTVVDTGSRFNQVLSWTMRSKFDKNLPKLKKLPLGIKENS